MHDLDLPTFLLNILFTWGIGLAPPLFVRYVLVKGPMEKHAAIITCAVLWIFNLALFISLGSQSKTHGVLIVIAIVSYTLLTRVQRPKEFASHAPQSDRTDTDKSIAGFRWFKKIVHQNSWRIAVSTIPLAILIGLVYTNRAIEQRDYDHERYTKWTPASVAICKKAEQDGLFASSPILDWQCTEPSPPKSIVGYVFESASQIIVAWLCGTLAVFAILSTLWLYSIETKRGWRRLSILVGTSLSILAGAGYMIFVGRIDFENSVISVLIASASFPSVILFVLGGKRALLWIRDGFSEDSKISN